tara:strand:+ start:239 stop:478 length:240 start_codon:yes stop_codon:yes gene_type:complete
MEKLIELDRHTKRVIDALEDSHEIQKAILSMRNKLMSINPDCECKQNILSSSECRLLGIEMTGGLAYLLALYKDYQKVK